MRIAITGGTGFLGHFFIRQLLEDGVHEPVVLTRQKGCIDERVTYKNTDYSVPSLREALDACDAVVHLAAILDKKKSLTGYQANVEITQNIYEACLLNMINNITYASTISVYSDENLLPWHENMTPNPMSMYGLTKLAGEYLGNITGISQASGEHILNVKNLRFAHIYGSLEQNEYMITKFMRQANNKQTLVIYSSQKAKREFLYVKDAAKALVAAVEAADVRGTFNIGSGESLTNLEAAEIINIAFDNVGNIRLENRSERELKSSFMISSKAKELLNFKTSYTFLEGMKDVQGECHDL